RWRGLSGYLGGSKAESSELFDGPQVRGAARADGNSRQRGFRLGFDHEPQELRHTAGVSRQLGKSVSLQAPLALHKPPAAVIGDVGRARDTGEDHDARG